MTDTELKPFQRVLVRDENDEFWKAHIFGYKTHDGFFCCIGGGYWKYCIPYEGNEILLNTPQSPTPPKPPFKFGDKVEVRNDIKEDWKQALFLFRETCDYPYNVMLPEINGIKSFKYCRHADW